jgi:predicted phosphodiesterase
VDSDYSLKAKRCLQEVVTGRKYRFMVNGHSHARLVRDLGRFVIINAGALCHPEDPGFVLLGFEQDLLQWYALRDGATVVAEERGIWRNGSRDPM